MMNDILDRFFEKSLNAEEEADFLKRLETDPKLKAEFDFRNSVKKAVTRKELKASLQQMEAKKSKDINPWIFGGIAASILLVFGVWVFSLNNPNKQLAYDYFQPLPNMVNPIVRGENMEDSTRTAFEKYEKEDYRRAIKEFEKLGEKSPEVLLYLGISYLAERDPEESIRVLSGFSTNDSTQSIESYRKWYLALAYLEDNQDEEAKKLLKDLQRYENPVQHQSNEIIVRISSE